MSKYTSTLARMLKAAGLDPDELMDATADPVKAYKLFRKKGDDLFPLFVNADQKVPLGEWLKAEAGALTDTGKVKSSIGPLAYRPGWHAGEYPLATHIGGKATEHGKIPTKPNYRPDDQVWAEIEMPGIVDWQKVANSRAEMTKAGKPLSRTAHITDQVPYGGHYRYKTNPNMTGDWLIGGDMRVNRILDDAEVRDLNRGSGSEDLPRLRNLQKRKGYVPALAATAVGAGALSDTEEAEAMPLYRAFRGEHGALADLGEKFQTRLGALSFGDAKTANHYAMSPNVSSDVPVQPRVYPSNVRIDNPVINNPEDPFLPFTDLEKATGFDHAKKVFTDLAGLNESEYIDDMLEEYGVDSIDQLPDDALRQLDVPAFEVFNDPETIQLMKANGYDGGITAGYGDNYDQVEFRPFDEGQVSPAFGEHPANSLGEDNAWREPPTVIPDSGKYVADRLGRAAEQGFDTSRRLFHGTANDIEAFDPGRAGMIYAAEDDPDYASMFAGVREGANVMPLYMRPGNQLDMVDNPEHRQLAIDLFNEKGGWANRAEMDGHGPDEAQNFWDEMLGDDAPRRDSYLYDPELDMDWEILDDPETGLLFDLQGMGYDSFRFKEDDGVIAQATHDPARIRSVNAQFKDPGSENILAGGTAAAVGLGALTDTQEAQAYDYGTGQPGAPLADPDAWMYERPALMEGALGGLPESLQAGILAAGKETDKLITGARDLFGSALGIDEEWRGRTRRGRRPTTACSRLWRTSTSERLWQAVCCPTWPQARCTAPWARWVLEPPPQPRVPCTTRRTPQID